MHAIISNTYFLSRKLMLGLAASIVRFEFEHMPSLITRHFSLASPFTASQENNIVILSSPGRAGGVARSKCDILQVSALGGEYHDTVRIEHGDP
jgi:hypothetical protein